MSKVSKDKLEFMRKIKEDGCFFSEKILNVKLHPYQEEIMRETHRFLAVCWSRQLGKSTIMAVKAIHYAVTNPKKMVIIISQDRDKASNFYRTMLNMINGSPYLHNMIKGEPTQKETILTNDTCIMVRAGGYEGKSLRGYPIDLLIIDEANYIPNLVYLAAEPGIASTRGSIWAISTPGNKNSLFYIYFKDGMKSMMEGRDFGEKHGYKSFHRDWTSGLEVFKPDGYSQIDGEYVKSKAKTMEKWEFEQEYMAIWSDDISSFFSSDEIWNCVDQRFTEKNYVFVRESSRQEIFMGIDFAKKRDKTVVTAIRRTIDGSYSIMFFTTFHSRNYNEQIDEINKIVFKLRPDRIVADVTGVGDGLVDVMNYSTVTPNGEKNYMAGLIDPMVMVNKNKTSIYNNLKVMIQNRYIRLPNVRPMLNELMGLQYDKGIGSTYLKFYPMGVNVDGEYVNDDYPDAIALACSLATTDFVTIPREMVGVRKLLTGKDYENMVDVTSDNVATNNGRFNKMRENRSILTRRGNVDVKRHHRRFLF